MLMFVCVFWNLFIDFGSFLTSNFAAFSRLCPSERWKFCSWASWGPLFHYFEWFWKLFESFLMIFEWFLDVGGFWGAFSWPTSLENFCPCEWSLGTNTKEGTKRARTETHKNTLSRRRHLFRYLKNGFGVICFSLRNVFYIYSAHTLKIHGPEDSLSPNIVIIAICTPRPRRTQPPSLKPPIGLGGTRDA